MNGSSISLAEENSKSVLLRHINIVHKKLRILNAALAVKSLVLNLIYKGTSGQFTKIARNLYAAFAIKHLDKRMIFRGT